MAIENNTSFKNIRALKNFRLKGKHVAKGDVVAKSDFASSGEYMNLCAMKPARAEQTNDKVGAAPKTKAKAAAALPGSE